MLTVQSATYIGLMNKPAVQMTILVDGEEREAFLCDIRKPLLDAGFVYLISLNTTFNWEEVLPITTVPAIDGFLAKPTRLLGLTDDVNILRIATQFWDDSHNGGFAINKKLI